MKLLFAYFSILLVQLNFANFVSGKYIITKFPKSTVMLEETVVAVRLKLLKQITTVNRNKRGCPYYTQFVKYMNKVRDKFAYIQKRSLCVQWSWWLQQVYEPPPSNLSKILLQFLKDTISNTIEIYILIQNFKMAASCDITPRDEQR